MEQPSESTCNAYKKFLLACMRLSVIPIDRAVDILSSIYMAQNIETTVDRDELQTVVNYLNEQLNQLNQTLSFYTHRLIDEEFIVFGSISELRAGQFQNQYKEADRNYFFKLMERMVEREDYGLGWMEVYTVDHNSNNGISKSRMQTLLKEWIIEGYFFEKNFVVYLGPRILTEFAKFLQVNYRDLVPDCSLCKKIVLWDVKCSNCNVMIHQDCIYKYLRLMSTCPSCSQNWSTPLNKSS